MVGSTETFCYISKEEQKECSVWQCKTCKKNTSLMPPKRKQSTTYHQKQNDILPSLVMDI